MRKVSEEEAERSNEVMGPLTSCLKHGEGRGREREEEEMTRCERVSDPDEGPDGMDRRWQKYQRNNRKNIQRGREREKEILHVQRRGGLQADMGGVDEPMSQ